MFLGLAYVGMFATLDTASSRMDTRFLAERERFRLSRLLPLPLDKPVSLIEGGHISHYFVLLSGWSEVEAWGDWSDGAEAEFALHLPETMPPNSYLKIWAQVSAPPGGQQTIRLAAGPTPLGDWRLSPPSAVMCVPLPSHLPVVSGILRLHMVIGAPQLSANGLDHRALGFGLGGAEMLSGKEGCGAGSVLPSG